MADAETQTPEEKLLKVIQKGESPSEGVSVTDDGAEATLGDASNGKPILRPMLSGAGPLQLKTLNHLLMVIALVFVGLSGYEMYCNFPALAPRYPDAALDLSRSGETLVMASLSDTLDMFDKRRILGLPPERWTPPDAGRDVETLKGWRAYARDHLNLKGISEVQKTMAGGEAQTVLEAIIMDTKVKKMHFLSTGQTIVLNQQEIRIAEIKEESVVLAAEEETLTIQ